MISVTGPCEMETNCKNINKDFKKMVDMPLFLNKQRSGRKSLLLVIINEWSSGCLREEAPRALTHKMSVPFPTLYHYYRKLYYRYLAPPVLAPLKKITSITIATTTNETELSFFRFSFSILSNEVSCGDFWCR
ncbi:hypothetical protein Glove_216g50 [Diversispora epigaea]|uniref:Uncharacterized protein n=1 Tax=Diversispora epigaea TaxID=1348612 RepID=A0A397IHG4_9GLOM|nr:hypothetical protein Glove_216g50 [Diversispora epigaea]